MDVTISMPLFGNPGHELEEGTKIKGADLRTLSEDLGERLRQAADALDKLSAGGWTAQVAMFDLLLFHPAVHTREQAEQLLRAVGVDPEQMMIVEDIEDEEGEE